MATGYMSNTAPIDWQAMNDAKRDGTPLAELYRLANTPVVAAFIPDGGWEGTAPEPRKPLDSSAPETFDGWVQCADGRTIWEYANGIPR